MKTIKNKTINEFIQFMQNRAKRNAFEMKKNNDAAKDIMFKEPPSNESIKRIYVQHNKNAELTKENNYLFQFHKNPENILGEIRCYVMKDK